MKPILALALALAACAVDEPAEGYDPSLGTSEDPIPGTESYALVSHVSFTLDTPALSRAIANVRAFGQAPAHTLATHAATSAAWQQLSSSLSAPLRASLEGWLDAELDKVKIATKPLRQYATGVADITESAVSHFAIESSLVITPTTASHSFNNLNFTPANLDILVPIGGLKADTIAQHTTATVSAGGALVLGEQQFSLAFGSHAWQAINLASTTLYGDDLTLFMKGVDCGAVARAVAARCSGTSCVGHATELQAVCTTGLAAFVDELRTNVASFQPDAFGFAGGRARLVDDSGDGIADRIVEGTWTTEADVSATFTGLD